MRESLERSLVVDAACQSNPTLEPESQCSPSRAALARAGGAGRADRRRHASQRHCRISGYRESQFRDFHLRFASGERRNPGTSSAPYRTLAYAQSVVRSLSQNMTSNITVYLENGTYQLSSPLEMGPQDSGTNGYNVVWTAAPGANPIISGARQITGWKVSNASKGIWSASVPAGLQTRQMYVNGSRAWMDYGAVPTSLIRTATGYKASSMAMASWRNPSGIEFTYLGGLGQWAEPICPISSINGETITMAQPCWNSTAFRRTNYVAFGDYLTSPTGVENAYELLTKPGEFYLDTHANVLYYIPRPGQNMRTADVEVPTLQTLVQGAGTAGNPIHDIVFSGLQFSYGTWMQPSTTEGFAEVRSGYTITGSDGYQTQGLCQYAPGGSCPYGSWTKEPGNVEFSYDQNLTFTNDRFVHLGASALNLDDGTQDATVSGSVFTDISGNGIEIGNVDLPEASGADQTTGVTITDNHLYAIGVEYHGSVAILLGYVADSTVSHNQIDHVPYSGISLGWGGWPDKIEKPPVANFAHDNVISDNLIYDFMEVLSDGGGVYLQGTVGPSLADGALITGNVVHNQLDWSWALKSDDGVSNATYSDNVLYNNEYDWGGRGRTP